MYNLLIGLTECSVDSSRVLEHTSGDIVQYVAPITPVEQVRGELRIDRVLNLPTLLMPEIGAAGIPQIARVGHVVNLVRRGRDYTFTFVPNPAVTPIPLEQIKAESAALGIDRWEFNRTHWAVKDIDLYRVIGERSLDARPKPKIFSFPTEKALDSGLVAVMMPFSAEFKPVYESLKVGIEEAEMQCLRADDIWQQDNILDEVLSLIWRARVVVADLTGKNPNVLYEAGIAHTLGRDTVLVAQSMDDLPFDLRSIRMLQYLNNDEGRSKLAEGIRDRLLTIKRS